MASKKKAAAPKKAATPAGSNTKPKGSASPSPTPGGVPGGPGGAARGASAGRKAAKEDAKNMGDADKGKKATAEQDTAADGKPRTMAGVKAVIHPAPHERWAAHPAGEDPDPDAKPNENNEQILYGLKLAGRLYRARHPDRQALMIEADDEECARQGAMAEYERLAKSEGKKKADETRVQVVPPPQPAELKAENVRVVKLPT
jgi:hypothetical protein